MVKKLLFLIAFLSLYSHALDRMWDARFTLGPEIRTYDKMGFGIGLRTGFHSDVNFPVNFQARLNNEIEIGGKLFLESPNSLEHIIGNFDLGAKYNLSYNSYIGIDTYFALNRNYGGGLIFTYSQQTHVARRFSNLYEIRVGFLDGITGSDGYMKLQVGFMPTLHIGKTFFAMVEMNSSGSIGNIQDDFMIDLMPKLELRIANVRLRLEVDIGILLEKNNSQKQIALYTLIAL